MDIEELEKKIEQYQQENAVTIKRSRSIILGWVFVGMAVLAVGIGLEYMPINFIVAGVLVLMAVVSFIDLL